MQRAAQTFHMPTGERWRTIAAGDELAHNDPAVTAAPQYFVPVEPTDGEPGAKTARRATPRRKGTR